MIDTSKALTVKMEVDLPANMLSDILTTAFDGVYGGCWVWCGPNVSEPAAFIMEGDLWVSVGITCDEDPDVGDRGLDYLVDHSVLAIGIQRVLDINSADKPGWRRFQDRLREAIIEDDAGMIDAEDADSIVQFGLFGKEVFG